MKKSREHTYKVGNYLVDEKVLTTKFACDFDKCHGACCNAELKDTELDGCSISEEEHNQIINNKDSLAEEIEDDKVKLLAKKLPAYIGSDGVYKVALYNGSCCIYSNAKGCIFKRKFGYCPDSCGLYPIIINYIVDVDVQKPLLMVDNLFDEFCKCAYEKGAKENIYLIDYLKKELIHTFGEKFFGELKKAQNELRSIRY